MVIRNSSEAVNPLKIAGQKEEYDIALIICPCYDYMMPPLGVACLASYLEKNRFRVKLLDFNIDLYSNSAENDKVLYQYENHRFWVETELFELIAGKFSSFI